MAGDLLRDIAMTSLAVDRSAHLRADSAFHGRARAADAQAIVVRDGQLAATGGQLTRIRVADVPADADLAFLGIDAEGRPHYAVDMPIDGEAWVGLRELAPGLGATDASLAVTAIALDHWRRRTRRCPACGGWSSSHFLCIRRASPGSSGRRIWPM